MEWIGADPQAQKVVLVAREGELELLQALGVMDDKFEVTWVNNPWEKWVKKERKLEVREHNARALAKLYRDLGLASCAESEGKRQDQTRYQKPPAEGEGG